jgi:uncharacterized protein YjdB
VGSSISAITGTPVACVGGTINLTNATPGGTWNSSSNSIATVSATGVVTGVSAATATITYTVGGCMVTTIATINASLAPNTGINKTCIGSTTTLANTAMGGTWASSNVSVATVAAATGVVSGIAPGTVMITYNVSAGCSRTSSVTVNALPTAIAGNTSICQGASTVLSSPGSAGVSWASTNTGVATIGSTSGVVSGVSAGTTTISFLATTGCIRTTTVTVNTVPSAGTITGPSTVIVGNTISLSDAVVGGTWISSNTAKASVNSSGLVTGIATGLATISYTVSNGGCMVSATKSISVTSTRPGITGSDGNGDGISVYPNPTSGIFTLQSSVAGTLSLFTMEGRLIAIYNVEEGATVLNMPNGTAAGIYMGKYNAADGATTIVRLVYEP